MCVCTRTVGSTQCPKCMVYGFGAMAAIFHCACLCVNMKLLFNHRYLSRNPWSKNYACIYTHSLRTHMCKTRSGDRRQTHTHTHTQTHSHIYLVVGVKIAWTLPPPLTQTPHHSQDTPPDTRIHNTYIT